MQEAAKRKRAFSSATAAAAARTARTAQPVATTATAAATYQLVWILGELARILLREQPGEISKKKKTKKRM